MDEVDALGELYDKLSNSVYQVTPTQLHGAHDECLAVLLSTMFSSSFCSITQLLCSFVAVVVQDGVMHKEEFMLALFKSKKDNLFGDRVSRPGRWQLHPVQAHHLALDASCSRLHALPTAHLWGWFCTLVQTGAHWVSCLWGQPSAP